MTDHEILYVSHRSSAGDRNLCVAVVVSSIGGGGAGVVVRGGRKVVVLDGSATLPLGAAAGPGSAVYRFPVCWSPVLVGGELCDGGQPGAPASLKLPWGGEGKTSRKHHKGANLSSAQWRVKHCQDHSPLGSFLVPLS